MKRRRRGGGGRGAPLSEVVEGEIGGVESRVPSRVRGNGIPRTCGFQFRFLLISCFRRCY